jgi:hypothetical protein
MTIPPPIQTVLDLFSSHLADVRFGDIDAPSLARLAADVHAASDVTTAAQIALDSARITLHERQEALLLQAQRALAYARVYAEADESLSARLEAVTLPRAARRSRTDANASTTPNELVLTTSDAPAARRPRGRPRKLVTPSTTPPLPEPMLEGLAQAGE